MINIFRQHLKTDANHMIHLALPREMGDEVEVIVFPRASLKDETPQESLLMAQLMDESGFAKNILNNAEEDCWNDL